jgi:2-polyprenyl-3-methyl-5-hydroxy-6-metoxy-1,4-benzoquinol methylase
MTNQPSFSFKEIPVTSWETNRWDKEWVFYFANQNSTPFFIGPDRAKLDQKRISQIAKATQDEMMKMVVAKDWKSPWYIHVKGQDIVGKSVLEIGCGAGYLGKQIGLVAKDYIGIDYSPLAVKIAKQVSPTTCDYFVISEFDAIQSKFGTRDIMICRDFFIHNNFENAKWVLKLAWQLLKPGGKVCADFFRVNPKLKAEVFPAKSQLSNFLHLVPPNFLNTVPLDFLDRVPADFLRVVPCHPKI